MATKKRESKLSKLIKTNCNQIHFTRIESKTINGIPDLNGCMNGKGFWMELKSDKVKYPKLSKWQIRVLTNCTDRCPRSRILVY